MTTSSYHQMAHRGFVKGDRVLALAYAQPDSSPRGPVAAIAGLGSEVPAKVLTNEDLERMVDTTDEWIVERTGIRERRLAAPEEATSDLAVRAAERALEDAGLAPAELDLIIVATATPDHLFPSTACLVQRALGAGGAAAMDLSAACTGFIYGLAVAEGVIASGRHENILVIGAETLSRITDYTDRNTCILFGDGAGAAVVRRVRDGGDDGRRPGCGRGTPRTAAGPCASRTAPGLLSVFLTADGESADLLGLPAGGSRLPASADTVACRLHYVKMDGPAVFRFAVGAMVRSVRRCLRASGLGVSDVDLLIPHQANARIIDAAVRLLRVPREKVFHTIESCGNVSSASIPISLDEARRRGRLRPGDTVVLVAFGAGMTSGGAVIRWDGAAGDGRGPRRGRTAADR